MPKIRFVVEYNGANFSGWQVQPGERTIQGALQEAFETVCGEPIGSILASGRTDTGVHAKGQIIVAEIPEGAPPIRKLVHSVSNILKNEVALRYGDVVADDFHPVRDAVRKQYVYTIYNVPAPPVLDYGSVWHVASELDLQAMSDAAKVLVGEHDFSSFRASGCCANSPVREILESSLEIEAPYIRYRVIGKGFLKQMVRNIVGTLVEIGKGRASNLGAILEAKDRRKAGPTAQPYGLCLDWVEYEDGFRSDQFTQ